MRNGMSAPQKLRFYEKRHRDDLALIRHLREQLETQRVSLTGMAADEFAKGDLRAKADAVVIDDLRKALNSMQRRASVLKDLHQLEKSKNAALRRVAVGFGDYIGDELRREDERLWRSELIPAEAEVGCECGEDEVPF